MQQGGTTSWKLQKSESKSIESSRKVQKNRIFAEKSRMIFNFFAFWRYPSGTPTFGTLGFSVHWFAGFDPYLNHSQPWLVFEHWNLPFLFSFTTTQHLILPNLFNEFLHDFQLISTPLRISNPKTFYSLSCPLHTYSVQTNLSTLCSADTSVLTECDVTIAFTTTYYFGG